MEKTHEIEVEERTREQRNSSKRSDRANEIRKRNENLSYDIHFEKIFTTEEADRTDLITKMSESAKELGLTPITDVLENFDGDIFFIFKKFEVPLFPKKIIFTSFPYQP